MRLDDQTREVITNTNNAHEFTIQNNAKMFQILSDKIYTYKPAAIVREISCNAYDSHIEAGIPEKPFRVVLPNDLHEYFEIEDFGVGLNEQEVYEIYTSYGASTKNDSNDVIGAFGLGSKTPFAYTTSFTIQTRKDGVEYLFNAYIGQNGAPTCSLLRKRDTEESNGVKIKIPVKAHHRDLFRRECQFILSFFPVRPEVVGNELFQFDFDEQITTDLKDGKVVVESTTHVQSELYQNKRIYAMMGTVCYPVNLQDLAYHVNDNLYKYLTEIVLKGRYDTSVFLNFDIGDLDVTASREALSIEDGKKTQINLVNKFNEKIEELIQEDKQAVDDCDHPLKALSYITNKYGDVIHFVRGLFEYQGKNLNEIASRLYRSPYNELFFLKHRQSIFRPMKTERKVRLNGHEFATRDYIILTAREEKTKGYVKYARDVANDNVNTIIVSTNNKVWTQHQIDRFAQYVGKPPKEVVYLEDIKANDLTTGTFGSKPKKKTPPKQKHEVTARSFLFTKTGGQYITQERIDIDELNDLDYDVVYTEPNSFDDKDVIRYTRDGQSIWMSIHSFEDIIKLTSKPMRVILSNSRNQKSIEQNKIQSLSDYMVNLIENRKDEIESIARVNANFERVGSKNYFQSDRLVNYLVEAESSVLTKEVYDLFDEMHQYKDYINSKMLNIYARILGKRDRDFELDLSYDKDVVHETYPMLKYIGVNIFHNEMMDDVVDYIKQIDQTKLKANKAA